MVKELTTDNYLKEVEQSDKPVIVDFWASWCGPCQMMGPVFEDLSTEYEGKLNFAKASTETSPELAQRNGVQGIPCLIVFKEGKEVGRIVGFKQKAQLKQEIDVILMKA